MSRKSGEGIVYSAVNVKKWAEKVPLVEVVRPGCCSRCGAASCPLGRRLVLIGHGLRERQVRGPAAAHGAPEIRTLLIRRYRCRVCGGITTVLPRGLSARRHYSASAIALGLCLYGLQRASLSETRQRVCAWRLTLQPERWTTFAMWVKAIDQGRLFTPVRPSPERFTTRQRAERAAATLCGLSLVHGTLDEQAFAGAEQAA
jgi:hypothetical protein